ncbi:tetratricopeptide repeat-containing sensor histidine kinase [Mongoliitalea daihaiensis]|uniref:tetratricopeptide repeat-containing sensor histidine kinase n=1 Tax=Mongoliitalea daihaiensis TaxID=2782006 RepID=UPI001F279F99|nr:tetratricopeptide repeat-containing sensor histidine kinase [Mongoliitalea daihaiensis]UJP64327.1 tetratricopeptide repeat-containing sensor histidine kinase [Mongoliitalea daihaiensis]
MKRLLEFDTIDSLNNHARDNFRIDFDASSKASQQALELSFQYDYKRGLAYAYRNLAILSYFSDNLSFSLDYVNKALEIFEQLGDDAGIADCYISLGTFFYRLGEHESSLKYHSLAYDYFRKSDQKDRYAIASYNLAESHFLNKDLVNAEKYLLESISINAEVNNLPLLASSYMYLGKVNNRKNQYMDSNDYLFRALEINEQLQESKSNKEVIVESHYFIGKNFKELNQIALAKIHFESSLSYSEKYKININTEENLFELGQLALSSKDFEESIKIFHRLREKYNQSNQTKSQNAQKLVLDILELRKIEKEALELRSENQKKEDRIFWLTFSSILLILVGLLLFALLFFYFRLFRKSKELQQLKSRFIAMAVHEFKNPLGIISSALELLNFYKEQLDNPSIKQKIEHQTNKIRRQENRLNDLVEDLMIFEQLFMDKYTLHPKKFDLISFFKSISDDLKDSDPAQRITIFECPSSSILVSHDKVLLGHLFSNILSNAYKYSIGNAAPKCIIEKNANAITVVIQDFGIGIPEIEQKFIFKEFFRASNVGEKKGSGIGLSIVQAIIQKLNGSIKLISEQNKGTTITVTLPIEFSS